MPVHNNTKPKSLQVGFQSCMVNAWQGHADDFTLLLLTPDTPAFLARVEVGLSLSRELLAPCSKNGITEEGQAMCLLCLSLHVSAVANPF